MFEQSEFAGCSIFRLRELQELFIFTTK